MEEKTGTLLTKIRQIIAAETVEDAFEADYPPISTDAVEAAERELGFSLPELLKLLYTEVANGGFGPYDRIIGLEGGWTANDNDGENLVELYCKFKEELPFEPDWPDGLLPICESGGNGTVFCLDTTRPNSPVMAVELDFFDEDEDEDGEEETLELTLTEEAPSFQSWLEDWAFKPHPNRK
jgi:hypothetical protein